ncbi:MAG TPA: PAS domain S-box protein [Steroidobacteraceae bacterium]
MPANASGGAASARDEHIGVSLNALSQGALLIGEDERITATNRKALRLFGATYQQLHDQPITAIIPDLSAQDLLVMRTAQRRPQRFEKLGRRQDGSSFPLKVAVSVVEAGGTTQLLLVLSDLTRRREMEAVVRDSRHGFRQLAQSLPQMLWSWRADGHAEYFSPQWVELTGVPAEFQAGLGWLDLLHHEDRAAVTALWRSATASARTFKTEFRLRLHDGSYRWIESTAVPVRDRGNTLVRWLGTNADIHDAYEMRQALIEERDRYSKLVASAPGAIYEFRLRPDGAVSFPLASKGIKDLFGLTAEELARDASACVSHIHPEDMLRIRSTMLHSAKHLTPWHCAWRVTHPQKGEIWEEARSVPLREADGGTLWHGIIMDVTDRKRAEEELLRSQSRLQAAVMASGIGTWIWDVKPDRLWWDEVLLRLLDRTREEVESGGLSDAGRFVQPEDREAISAALAEMRAGTTDTLSVEYRTIRNDGALQWIAVNGRVDRDSAGRMVRVTGACIDITARKRAEDAQRHSQKLEALGTLAGGIAHDFNNLLLAISGNCRLAAVDLAPEHSARRHLEEIEHAGARATNLVHRILAFSRQSEPRQEIIYLQPTIEEALRLMRATVPAMIIIEARFAPDVPSVNADSTQIHQVVMNLITNAAHAVGDKAGTVTLSLDTTTVAAGDPNAPVELSPGRYARMSVSDTGSGMDSTTLRRIFDPFFTTKPVGQGTGLGLSVVHGIVRSHQGLITVHSDPGRGSTFSLYFPARSQPAPDQGRPSQEAAKGRGQRVLYVDDEDSLVYLATRVLQRLGYKVSGFTDPGQALQEFQAHAQDFDVVVTDMSMPGMSGLHLASALLAIRADIPVLMTSGYVRAADREAARLLGVRELILKPNTVEDLGHVLERLFRTYGTGP